MSATSEPKGSSGAGLDPKSEPANKPTFKTSLISRASSPPPATSTPAPATPLLLDLLRYRPTLNRKRTASFLSLRKWPLREKDSAIDMLKDAKDRGDLALATAAAEEIANVLSTWIRPDTQIKVTAPPAGVKRPVHFATLIAQTLARRLKLEHQTVFAPRRFRGSSYPKKDSERGLMKTIAPAFGHWILIDDVSSSGSTLETALHTLLQSGAASVIPVCWIYGSADKDLPAEPVGVTDSILGSPDALGANESEHAIDAVTRNQFIARITSFRVFEPPWPFWFWKMFDDLKTASPTSFSRPLVNTIFATA